MPQTKKGKEAMSSMMKEYGPKKGKEVYYASIVKGKLKGAEKLKKGSQLKKAMNTYKKKG